MSRHPAGSPGRRTDRRAAGAIAGSAVWISFLIGGVIALLTGYSLGKLGARYPSAGGMVEYLIHGWGSSLFSGSTAVLMYLCSLLTLAIGGLAALEPALLAPSTYPGGDSIAASVAVTFFAYEGFRVITNAAEAVDRPERTIPRAITASILLVHTAVHVGHLRLLGRTGAHRWVVLLAGVSAFAIVVYTLVNAARQSWTIPAIFVTFVAVSFGAEWIMRLTTRHELRTRVER